MGFFISFQNATCTSPDILWPSSRFGSSFTTIGNKLFLFGGAFYSHQSSVNFWKPSMCSNNFTFDIHSSLWSPSPFNFDLEPRVFHHSYYFADSQSLFIFGGVKFEDSITYQFNSIHSYNLQSHVLSKHSDSFYMYGGVCLVGILPHTLIFMGGVNNSQANKYLFCFDMISFTLSSKLLPDSVVGEIACGGVQGGKGVVVLSRRHGNRKVVVVEVEEALRRVTLGTRAFKIEHFSVIRFGD